MSEKERTEVEQEDKVDRFLLFADIFLGIVDTILLLALLFLIYTVDKPTRAETKVETYAAEQSIAMEESQEDVKDEIVQTEKEEVVEEEPLSLEELYPDLDLEKKGYVNASNGLNVHEEADLNSKKVGLLDDWQIVDILDSSGDMYKIQTVPISKLLGKEDQAVTDDVETIVGYVSKDYINKSPVKKKKYLLISAVVVRNSSLPNRDHNMSLACSKIDGIVLMPGEEFNWLGEDGVSGVVGQASQENGYEQATILVNKKAVLGYGGGVCQVSTSLYNLIMLIGIEPTEIHHHSVPSHYIAAGKDATIASSSNPDNDKNFVFTNTKDYPIMIKMSEEAGCVTALCYRILTQE